MIYHLITPETTAILYHEVYIRDKNSLKKKIDKNTRLPKFEELIIPLSSKYLRIVDPKPETVTFLLNPAA